MIAICAELKKSRRRHNALVAVGISLAALLWATQTGGKSEDVSQGYSGLLYAIPIINTVIMPLGTAVLASRLWDLESKEKCCRILLTLQSRASLFFGKAAAALLQIFLMVAAESAGILALGKWAGYTDALDFGQFWWLAAATFMVNAMLFFLWLFLSVRFDNQVPTLAGGMVGSLSGLFASFMPPMVSFFMPWGYYIPLEHRPHGLGPGNQNRPLLHRALSRLAAGRHDSALCSVRRDDMERPETQGGITMLMRCIRAENRKLRRSPIWLLFLAVPAISAIYGTFNYRMNQGILTHGWYDLWTQYTLFYALFFFAPLIGVYAAYLWRLEHRGHNWNLIMTAPVRPFALYAAKFCVVAKMAFLTQIWLLVLFLIGGKLGAGLTGFPPPEILLWLLRGAVGGLPIIAIQLLLSMVIRNFALPVLMALGGSILGLMATTSNAGLFWPYSLMLMGMNSNRTEDVMTGQLPGFFLSCIIFLAIFLLTADAVLAKQDVKA